MLRKYLNDGNGGQAFGKVVNRARIVAMLRGGRHLSRAFLATSLGLTRATVSSQVAELISLGVVHELGTGESSGGRRAVMIGIDGAAGVVLGLSVSTGDLHVLVRDLAGNVVADQLVPLASHEPEAVVRAAAGAVRAVRERFVDSRYGLVGSGIAVPGTVDRSSGTVYRSAKLGWSTVPLGPLLEAQGVLGVSVGNDATLACIAEHELSSPETQNFVSLIIDEGIGSGAYINGAPFLGSNDQFGEFGHMTISQAGERCPCGNVGCWDLYGSELALTRALGESRGTDPLGPEALSAALAHPDEATRRVLDSFVAYNVSGVVSILNAIAPSVVVINSSVFAAAPDLFGQLKAGVASRALARPGSFELRLSRLGKTAPATGAALAAADAFFDELALSEVH